MPVPEGGQEGEVEQGAEEGEQEEISLHPPHLVEEHEEARVAAVARLSGVTRP